MLCAAPLPVVLQAKTGTATTPYLYAIGTRPIAQYTSGNAEYLLPDALGSVRQIADADGDVTLAESYEPRAAGSVLTSIGTASSIFGYAGEQLDNTTGLIYLRARYMNPRLGIFLARDPWSGDVLRPRSMNGFNYVSGNPINLTDPTGMDGPVVVCRDSPQVCDALAEAVRAGTAAIVTRMTVAGGATLIAVSAPAAVIGLGFGAALIWILLSPPQKNWPPPPPEAPAPPKPVPTIYISPIPQPLSADDVARNGGSRGPAPAPQRQPKPEPNPEPKRGPIDPGPWVTCTPTPEKKSEFIYRNGSRMKDLSLHRTVDWETGLSFFDIPSVGAFIKYRVSVLRASGYVVRPDGSTIVEKLWGQGVYFDSTGQSRTFSPNHVTVYHANREYWDAWHQADLANLNTPRVSPQIQFLYSLREP